MSLFGAGHRLTWVLLLCCLALAGLLARELFPGTREAPPPAAAGTVSGAGGKPLSTEPAFDPPARAAFDEILERPLFSAERRPPPEPPAVTQAAPARPLRLKLLGVATVGEAAVALVRDLDTQQLTRLSEGMEYQGWTLTALEPGRAVLRRGEQTEELELELDKSYRPSTRTPVPRRR